MNAKSFRLLVAFWSSIAFSSTAFAAFGSPSNSATRPYLLSVGPTLGVLNSQVGFGGSVAFLYRYLGVKNYPFYIGAETGFVTWSQSATYTTLGTVNSSASVTSIPIMPTAVYTFDIPNVRIPIKGYIGAALGISITSASRSVRANNTNTMSVSATGIDFEGLLKPGVEYMHFFFEPKFGLLKDQFVFLPTIGYNFAF